MRSVAGVEVLDAGNDVRRLLACLRQRAREDKVGISPGQTGVLVIEAGGYETTTELHDFLEAQLDECSREVGVEWLGRLSVSRRIGGDRNP